MRAWLLACALLLACGAEAPRAQWARVSREDLPFLIDVTGVLRARDSVQLGPPLLRSAWEYKIASLATEGLPIQEGQPVLSFDTAELRRTLEEQQNEVSTNGKYLERQQALALLARRNEALRLAEAEAALRKAALKVDKPSDLVGALELEEARLDLALAQRELTLLRERSEQSRRYDEAELAELRDRRARAELRVKETLEETARMTVRAPRSGVVIYMVNRRDEKKKLGDSVWRGEKVLEIADLGRLQAQGEVDEADAAKVAVGLPVMLRLDAHPDSEVPGTIERIASAVTRQSSSNANKVVRLEIALSQIEPRRMRPGMRFRGTIERGRVRAALLIPLRAVRPGASGPVCLRRGPGGAVTVPLELGQRGGDRVEVHGGLREGDEVLLLEAQ